MSTVTDNTNVFTFEKLVLAGMAHPTRIMILMVMGEDPSKRWSPSDMTTELQRRVSDGKFEPRRPITLGSVSYHFRPLLQQRWIKRSGTGKVRGALENFYTLDGRRV